MCAAKVRDAQTQANRERLERESDNREDMVALLVAEQKLSASATGKQNGMSKSGRSEQRRADSVWKVPAR